MEDFRNLIDVTWYGGIFIWYTGGGNAMRRLDRFLLSESLVITQEICKKIGVQGNNSQEKMKTNMVKGWRPEQ